MVLANLVKRNMLMFLKDRAAVFFSLLSMLIILLLYILFLAKMNIDTVQGIVNIDRKTAGFLVNSWVMAGIIIVNSVTVTLGALGIMIDDEVKKRLQAFLVSPVSRFKLTLGYILSSFVIGNILCLLTLAFSEAYIAAMGGSLLSFAQILSAVAIIAVSVFSSTCFVFFIVTFIRTTSTYTSLSIILCSVIGFAAGLYIPVGVLPDAVQKAMKLLPVFYDSSVMRGIFVSSPVSRVFGGIPRDASSGWLQSMGINISWGDFSVTGIYKIAITVASGLIFLVLSTISMQRRKQTV